MAELLKIAVAVIIGANICVCASQTPQELVESFGYPFESHWVTTPDGYILNLHRIPHGTTGKVNNKTAFLQHGILSSSTDWILFGTNSSLGYILADEGYDVWMGNVRGNRFSRNHTVLNPDQDHTYWDFSWHEMGYYDLPAMIDFVISKTGVDSIYYLGHSQGTTVFYVMTSTRPEYNMKIKAQVSLAPIAFLGHLISPLLRAAALMSNQLGALFLVFGQYEFLPSEGFIAKLSNEICKENEITEELCKNVLFALVGFNYKNLNISAIPLITSYVPAGASTKQFLHYTQSVNWDNFRQYNYGISKNIFKYGKVVPPDYDISKITAPIHLFYGDNDWLALEKDVERLYRALPNATITRVPDPAYNHVDFIYGINSPIILYPKIIDILNKH